MALRAGDARGPPCLDPEFGSSSMSLHGEDAGEGPGCQVPPSQGDSQQPPAGFLPPQVTGWTKDPQRSWKGLNLGAEMNQASPSSTRRSRHQPGPIHPPNLLPAMGKGLHAAPPAQRCQGASLLLLPPPPALIIKYNPAEFHPAATVVTSGGWCSLLVTVLHFQGTTRVFHPLLISVAVPASKPSANLPRAGLAALCLAKDLGHNISRGPQASLIC